MVQLGGASDVPSLFVIRGTDQGLRYELTAPVVGLGREPGNTVVLHDHEVSRRHAELRSDGLDYTLLDLDSSNGVFVNGNRVRQRRLASGDQVQLGATLLLYTGVLSHADGPLDEGVDILPRDQGGSSRIVRSISQEEGSRILSAGDQVASSPWLARARDNLQIMYHTALAVSHTLDIDQLLSRILDLIFEWVAADRGCVMLVHPETGKLEAKARRDRRLAPADQRMAISQTILDYVIQRRQGVLTSDAREDHRWTAAASIVQHGVHEAICVPMQGRYDLVGVIYLDTSTSPEQLLQVPHENKFNEEHLKLLIAIAHQAALAVEDTRYYSAMVQAERLAAIGQTIATLSHHIKNILQGVRGGSYLIEMGLSQHDEKIVRKGWDIVERNQKKISNLVLDMLTFSKDREPELLPADLNATVQDVVEVVAARAADLGMELVWLPAADMPYCTFDPDGIHRAVLNVVTNAIDACEGQAQRKVVVSTHYDAAAALLRVEVTDSGPGIAPEDQDHIFSLFVSHKGNRGTGLGLPVTRKIIQEHGGRVSVTSQLDHGTRFVLELPAVLPDATLGNPRAGDFPAAIKLGLLPD